MAGSKTADDWGTYVDLSGICYISVGMVIHCDERKKQGLFKAEDLISETPDKTHPKPYFEGKDIIRWGIRRVRYLEYGTRRAPEMFRRPTFPQFYEVPEKLTSMDISGGEARVAYDDSQLFHNHSAWSFVPWHYLRGVKNKSIRKTAKYKTEVKRGEAAPARLREELEALSKQYDLKYLLALMNSTFASKWLLARRRSKLHVYPDDWKTFPVPPIAAEQQQEFVKLVDVILAEIRKHGHPLPRESADRVAQIEREIDERVAALYVVPLNDPTDSSTEPVEADSIPFV